MMLFGTKFIWDDSLQMDHNRDFSRNVKVSPIKVSAILISI